ncbi:MAG TPA: DNA mismatch repair protein MutS [Terracidiphilus sp.]|nr:DNA mismatch repair protein MutS [Terracidiphilus sp.]
MIRDDSQPRSVHIPPPGTAPLLDAALPPHTGEVCASVDAGDVTDPEGFALTSLPVDRRQDESNSTELTPFMRQWTAAKKQNPDALLFFRMGDFYELFYDDAAVASRELQLTLTARDRERSIPMCGVPYHAVEQYLTRLLRRGYRIALCDQMEDPKLTKKIVRREVTRVLTPGTALDAGLGQEQNNFLAALYEESHPSGKNSDAARVGHPEAVCALALLDVSTGEFRTAEFRGVDARAQAIDALLLAAPSEVLLATSAELPAQLERIPARTRVEDWVWTRDFAVPLVERQLNVRSLEGFGLNGHDPAAIAAGAVLHYVRTTQKNEALHIDSLKFEEHSTALELDQVTVHNLELVEPLFSGQDDRVTFFRTLDSCLTPMGKRLLRATILRPLNAAPEIGARYEAVGEAQGDLLKREEMRRAFGGILDLERLLARISLDSAGPRDVRALAASLARLPGLKVALEAMTAPRWRVISAHLDTLDDVTARIVRTLVAEPPLTLVDGGAISPSIDAELDELRAISSSGRQAIAAIEDRERQRTGIGSLKVRYNSVFGYYIEITKANLALAPADYERKQTLVNAERFTTPELKDYERKILTAHDRCIEIEKRIFAELRKSVLEGAGRIRRSSAVVAEADLLACFAHLAAARRYVRPQLVEEPVLEAVAARHPVIEQWMEETREGRFIANDLYLCAHHESSPKGETAQAASLLLVTGPNMGGKSTYLRQAAMLVLMAQMGSFVPADSMRFGLVDRVYTRIGASDNVARGRSTFMVEMTETATILNTATSRSLILLDEMGRGTATFDGLSLAWATVEFLHAEVGARTLFATHYHELTMLAEKLPRVRNLRVGVKESASGIVFLHNIEPGAASKSYGIEVARLAGLPPAVIERAKHVLRQHEKQERQSVQVETEPDPMQMTIFTPLSQRIVDRIEATDVNSLTPLQALNLLEELQQELKKSRD